MNRYIVVSYIKITDIFFIVQTFSIAMSWDLEHAVFEWLFRSDEVTMIS